jgi:hypothetical protein
VSYTALDKPVAFHLTAVPGQKVTRVLDLPVTYVLKSGETRLGIERITLTLENSLKPATLAALRERSNEVEIAAGSEPVLLQQYNYGCVGTANRLGRSFQGAVEWSAAYGYQQLTDLYPVSASASWPWLPGAYAESYYPSGATNGTIVANQVQTYQAQIWPYPVSSNILDWTLYLSGQCGVVVSFTGL